LSTFLFIIGSVLIAATVLPMFRAYDWWIRIFDFPRSQITVAAIGVFVAAPFFLDLNIVNTVFIALLGLSAAYQIHMMYPYLPVARPQVEQSTAARGDESVHLLFANVLQDNRRSADLLKIVERVGADIVLLVETDDRWARELSPLRDSYPNVVECLRDDTYGMMLFSRLELIDPEIKFLVDDHVPSIHSDVLLRSGRRIAVRCLHPPPPVPTFATRSIERDAELLLVGKEVRDLGIPVIVFGDLNDVAWSRTNYLFQDISGLLDPRIGRGFYNTFHAEIPVLRFPLDHCFHSNHFRLIDFKRLEYFGSDHFPVNIILNYEPDARVVQEELVPGPEQLAEAEEVISEKLEEAASDQE
jgi:endonuclease/exonuclease/phosphatase (EEP) superfamily protein YafD